MCDTVVVVRPEGVLFAKSSDRDPNEAQRLEWHPPREAGPGAMLRCTWVTIPEVRRARATLLSRPYWMWGAEMGVNDAGVMIGNEAVFTRASRDRAGLTGMDLLRLALERAGDAEEACAVLASLLEAHGQGGRCGYDDPRFAYDNSFLVADGRQAFVLETAGREWASRRVEGVRAISNALSIEGFEGSRADRLRGAVAQAATRRACLEGEVRRALSELRGEPRAELRALIRALRSHGEGPSASGEPRSAEPSAAARASTRAQQPLAARPRYSPINGAMGGPCMHAGGLVANSQTVASWVARLGSDGDARTGEHWVTATAAPCLSAFKPVRFDEPIDLGAPTGIRASGGVYWAFEDLHRALVGAPDARLARYLRERDALEGAWLDGDVSSTQAFEAWAAFVERWRVALASDAPTDGRPWVTRRYWAAREADARASSPRMPARA